MPPVVAAVGAVVASLGTAGTIALAVGVAAAGYAYYAAQKAKNMNMGSTKAAERKQTFRSSNAPKQVIFGESEASGPIVFVQEEGDINDSGAGEILHMVVPLAGHECDDCLGVRIGDQLFSKVGNTAEGSHWRYRKDDTTHGDIWYYSRTKNAVGVPDSLKGVAQWDENMIGCGQTFLHARLRSDPDQWPSGVEDIVAKMRGWWVYDPRIKKQVWSTNPVLQARHYIRHVLLVPEAHIIEDTFIQAANICDEVMVRAGKSEPRYCCHAIFDEESEPAIISLSIPRPQAPADLVFTPFLNDSSNAGEVHWNPVANSSGYQVRLCRDNEILVESRVSDNRWLIAPLSPADYAVMVATISLRENALSEWSTVPFTLTGLDTPKGLTAKESLIGSGIQIISQVVLACEPVDGATNYEFEYQALGSGSWSGIQSGPAITATLNAIPPGSYTFRVRAISGSRRSGYTSLNFGVDGTQRPPASLDDLRLHAQAGAIAQLSWSLSNDPDVLTGGAIHVRHTHFIGPAATWDSAVPVTDRLPGNATLTSVPLLSGTYLVKPVNAGGYWAEEPAAVASNMAGLIGYNRVVEREEPDGWPGEKNKAVVEAGDSLTFAESTDNNEPPFYIMEQPLDLGAVITARLTLEVDGSVYFADTIDERTTMIDDWPLFDGAIPDNVSLRYEVSQTNDNPQSSGASWSQWTPFLKGEFRARGFRLRISMQGNAPGSAATIAGLKLIADVAERTEQGANLAAQAGGLRVNYQTPFLKPAAIGITGHALPANGRFELSNQNSRGFDIRFFDGNTAIAAHFDYSAVSYGEAE